MISLQQCLNRFADLFIEEFAGHDEGTADALDVALGGETGQEGSAGRTEVNLGGKGLQFGHNQLAAAASSVMSMSENCKFSFSVGGVGSSFGCRTFHPMQWCTNVDLVW